jgi:hypothetical protein
MQKFILLGVTIFILCGCTIGDFGATNRTQIRANADVAIATAERDAVIGAAQAEADGKAQAARAWSSILPTIVFFVGATVVVALVINWRGRLAMERTKRQALLPGDPGFYPALRRIARRDGAQIEVSGGRYYLVADDDSREVKGLLAE